MKGDREQGADPDGSKGRGPASSRAASSPWAGIGDPGRLQQIIENIPDMIFLKEAKDLRFVGLNRAGEELLGYDREDLLGKNDFDFFPEEEASFFVAKDREVLEGGKLVEIAEEPIHTRHLGERILHTKKVPIFDEDGKPVYLLGISEDITELKRTQGELLRAREDLMESRLRESQRMEQLGILAGGIAHDFNNLLVGILGNASLAQDHAEADHPVSGLLNKIVSAAQGAAGLTQQMLAYSGRSRFVLEPIDLAELVTEISDLLTRSLPKSIRMVLDLSPKVNVLADASQMRQLVMNLITNAADALEGAEGQIRVQLESRVLDETLAKSPWDIGEATTGPYACLVVSDAGIGMDESTLTRMFDPFFSTKEKGHGLGLSAIVGIVEAHLGVLRVSSELDEGTRFLVALPQVEATCAPQGDEVSQRPLPKGLRVLIVDDEPGVRDVAKSSLSRAGLSCTTTESGEEALEVLAANPDDFDLILLDLSMPGMGGQACLQEARRIRPGIPILLSSGFDERNSPLAADAFTDFLAKPYALKQLHASIARLLADQRKDEGTAPPTA